MSIGKAQSSDEKVKDQPVVASDQSSDDWGFGKKVRSLSREAKWAAAGIALILLAFAVVVSLRWKGGGPAQSATAVVTEGQPAASTSLSDKSATSSASTAASSFTAGSAATADSTGTSRLAEDDFLLQQTEPPSGEAADAGPAASSGASSLAWSPQSEAAGSGNAAANGSEFEFAKAEPLGAQAESPRNAQPADDASTPSLVPVGASTADGASPVADSSGAAGTEAAPDSHAAAGSPPLLPGLDEPRTGTSGPPSFPAAAFSPAPDQSGSAPTAEAPAGRSAAPALEPFDSPAATGVSATAAASAAASEGSPLHVGSPSLGSPVGSPNVESANVGGANDVEPNSETPDGGLSDDGASSDASTSRPVLLVAAEEPPSAQAGDASRASDEPAAGAGSAATSGSGPSDPTSLQVALAPRTGQKDKRAAGRQSTGRARKANGPGKHRAGGKGKAGRSTRTSRSGGNQPGHRQNDPATRPGNSKPATAGPDAEPEQPSAADGWPVGADPFGSAQPGASGRQELSPVDETTKPSRVRAGQSGSAGQPVPVGSDPFGATSWPGRASSDATSSDPFAPAVAPGKRARAATTATTSVTKGSAQHKGKSSPDVEPDDFGALDGFLPPEPVSEGAGGRERSSGRRTNAGLAGEPVESLPPRPSPVEPQPTPLFGSRTPAPGLAEPFETGGAGQPAVKPARPVVRTPGRGAGRGTEAPVAESALPSSASPFGASGAGVEANAAGQPASVGVGSKAGEPGSGSSPFDASHFQPPLGPSRPKKYVVQQNDTFWTISKKVYGTARYFQALALYNKSRIPDPRRMRPGMTIEVPPPQVLESRFPELVPRAGSRTGRSTGRSSPASTASSQPAGFFLGPSGEPLYRVGPEDTLSEIAQRHLGRASRWIQIFELNRDKLQNPNDLKIGTVLRLPRDARGVRVTETPRTNR